MLPVYALIVVQIADAVTTFIGLSHGARETNRYVRVVLDRVGRVGWALVKAAMVAACARTLWAAGRSDLIWVVVAVMLLIVANNLRVIAKQRRR